MTVLAIGLAIASFIYICWEWATTFEPDRPTRAYVRKLRRNRADLRKAMGRKP